MSNTASTQTHYRACNICEAICGLEIKTQGDEILSIKGDKRDPLSKGHICPKAIALQDVHNDPDRLKQPLKKTVDGWETISWNQAFKEVAENLHKIQCKHGDNAVASYQGNPSVHSLGSMIFSPFFIHALKTQNRFTATSVDQLPHQLASSLMFGHELMVPIPDIDRTDYFLMLGANPVVSNGSLMTAPGIPKRLKALKNRQGKLVVIDPRKTETAALADKHIFIKPGTDPFLMLAIIHTVFEQGLENPGDLIDFTDGVDTIKELVSNYPASRAAVLTGIPTETIIEIAQDFCQAKTAVCYGRFGVSTQEFGSIVQWLIVVLNLITGNLDKAGGAMFTTPAIDILDKRTKAKKNKSQKTRKPRFARSFSRVSKLPEFDGCFPVTTLAEEILTEGDGQIKAVVTMAGNPILSTPNGLQLDRAFENLDYMVAIDYYLNETTRHANIILPPTSSLERSHYDLVFHIFAVQNTAKYSPTLFKAKADTKSDREIFLELEARLATKKGKNPLVAWFKKLLFNILKEEWVLNKGFKMGPYANRKDQHNRVINLKTLRNNPHGIDFGPLQPCLPERLFTTPKKIQLAPAHFVNDLKRLDQVFFENNEITGSTEFVLIGRRDTRTNNSWMHNSYRLIKGKDRCLLQINPADAKALSINDKDIVEVSSRVGKISLPAEITETIMPGVVCMPHGWGHARAGIRLQIASKRPGVSINDITDDQFFDKLSGNAVLNGIPVRLKLLTHSPDRLKETTIHEQ